MGVGTGVKVDEGVGVGAKVDEGVTGLLTLVDMITVCTELLATIVVVMGGTTAHSKEPSPVFIQTVSSLQGLGTQGSTTNSHKGPVNPIEHVQLNVAKRLLQVALFIHRLISHSLISSEQFFPVKPGKQTQVYVELPSIQDSAPTGSHGLDWESSKQ